ncbi:hypothetical protein [Kitasatospora sp. NPDC094015]|uniref:hypothetical protein n=1 Tax=Kitasatospora sp. NPDC094015 TaxID=3155205 RepID=UPI0033269AAD
MMPHFEVVLTCVLRDDTPDTVLDALRWHLGTIPERPSSLNPDEHPYAVLTPDPESPLPGGDFASLRRRSRVSPAGHERYSWGLFSRNRWPDDEMGLIVMVLHLLAPHVEEPGYSGYYREEHDPRPTILTFQDGSYGTLKPLPQPTAGGRVGPGACRDQVEGSATSSPLRLRSSGTPQEP